MTTLPVPDDSEPRTVVQVTCSHIGFSELAASGSQPRYVDMMDGRVYSLPAGSIASNGASAVTFSVPVADWPVLITDASVVSAAVLR